MKHNLIYLLLLPLLLSCGGNEEKEQASGAKGTAEEPATTEAQAEGRQLIKQSDCIACHLDDAKLIGPAYEAVAEKYPDNQESVSHLAGKIIQGGSGVWGEVPMTPHPQTSQEEAEKMARYILTLK